MLQSIGVQAQSDGLFGPKLGSIHLQGYTQDGCPAEPNFSADVHRTFTGCNPITSTGITKVVVIANDKLPSTCILFLFDNSDCAGAFSAKIGPITPTSIPSACIGPIRNPAGNVFQGKAVRLLC